MNWPVENAPCCYGTEGCVCTDMEQALRAWAGAAPMPPMTPEQREDCLDVIGGVEGFVRADFANESDETVAKGVLEAWTEYARDKGCL
jgi:hypothetical protein